MHWQVVLAGCAGMAMSTLNVYSVGVFLQPLETAFGWSRGAISAGPAIAAFSTVVLGPFAGAAIDRLGPRRIGLTGIVLLMILTAALSLVGPNIRSWWGVWILLALINTLIQPTIWTAAVSGFFALGRGLALAATLSGSGIASLITPILSFHLIERYGWRFAYVALASIWGSVSLPLIWLFLTSRTDQNRIARRDVRAAVATRPRRAAPPWSWRFVQLALAGFLIAAVVVPLTINLVPILSWNGLPQGRAASTAALLGLASVPGRLLIGHLLDRLEARYLAAVSVSLPILSCALLLHFPGSSSAAAAAVLILGLTLGAELDLVAYLTSRYFGLAHFGLLFGTIAGLVTLAGGAGPWAVNLVYDAVHSYRPVLLFACPMCIGSAVLFLLLKPGSYSTEAAGAQAPGRAACQ